MGSTLKKVPHVWVWSTCLEMGSIFKISTDGGVDFQNKYRGRPTPHKWGRLEISTAFHLDPKMIENLVKMGVETVLKYRWTPPCKRRGDVPSVTCPDSGSAHKHLSTRRFVPKTRVPIIRSSNFRSGDARTRIMSPPSPPPFFLRISEKNTGSKSYKMFGYFVGHVLISYGNCLYFRTSLVLSL